jgi:hypothetical protein
MTATTQAPQIEKPTSATRSPRRPEQRKRSLPAFPNEAIYLEAKFIDNSMVVRAEDPKAGRHCWRAALTVVTISAISAGLMLPSAFRMITGQKIVAERNTGKQLRAEIAELQAKVAQFSGRKHLEEYAKAQDLVDPEPSQVQHITPKGSYAQNSLPSGK